MPFNIITTRHNYIREVRINLVLSLSLLATIGLHPYDGQPPPNQISTSEILLIALQSDMAGAALQGMGSQFEQESGRGYYFSRAAGAQPEYLTRPIRSQVEGIYEFWRLGEEWLAVDEYFLNRLPRTQIASDVWLRRLTTEGQHIYFSRQGGPSTLDEVVNCRSWEMFHVDGVGWHPVTDFPRE